MRKFVLLAVAATLAVGAFGMLIMRSLPGADAEEAHYVGKGHMISDIQLPEIMPVSAFDSN
jgi:hypothetical protein